MGDGPHGRLPKVGAVIQARYDSSRLPGKVLLKLPFGSQNSILGLIVERLRLCHRVHSVIIATSEEQDDYKIWEESQKIQCGVFRGSKENVLERFVKAGEENSFDTIIRITGDNPLVLNDEIDSAILRHINGGYDYTRNLNLPYGTGFEIVNLNVLKKVLVSSPNEDEKEHVTLYLKRNKERFKILEIEHQSVIDPNFRFTIDYASDYAFMNILLQHLLSLNYKYKLKDICDFVSKHPWLTEINKSNQQKKQYNSLEDEIKGAIKILQNMGLQRAVKILSKSNLKA